MDHHGHRRFFSMVADGRGCKFDGWVVCGGIGGIGDGGGTL